MGMVKRRRRYDREFKENVVQLLLSGDKTTKQLSNDLDISISVLTRWKRTYLEQLDESNTSTPASELEGELRTLRKEVISLRTQRDILKKALSICTQPGPGDLDS